MTEDIRTLSALVNTRTVLEAQAEPGHRHATVKRQIAAQTLVTLDALRDVLEYAEDCASDRDERPGCITRARAALAQWR
jgi:hypothetical protein